MKNILVTGGCGFVGRHLIALLAREAGTRIFVIDNLSTGKHPRDWETPRTEACGAEGAGADEYMLAESGARARFLFADFAAIAQAEMGVIPPLGLERMPRFDEIYHLASVVGGRNVIDNDPLAVGIDLAIDSTFFLWAAKHNRPERILYASSSAAYPVDLQHEGRGVALKEEYIDFGERLGLPDYTYGWSKLSGEYLSRVAVRKYGLKVGVVRPFSGYGEDQETVYPFPAIALRAAAKMRPMKVWGSGRQSRDFVHIDDACEACLRICRTVSDARAYNVGSGKPVQFRELAARMVELAGYETEVVALSDKPEGVGERYADVARISAELDWSPKISLDDGIARALAYAQRRLERGMKPD